MLDFSGLRVAADGRGPVIVATHGLGDDHTVFDGLTPALTAAGHQVVRWDLPGHGGSWDVEVPDSGCGLEVLEHVAAAQAAPLVLLGHSLGGYLSLAYAARHPGEVAALVLLSTGPGYRNPEARSSWNDYIERAGRKMRLADGAAVLGRQTDSSVIDALPHLEMPVLHVVGEQDERYHAGAHYMESVLPYSRLAMIPGGRHKPQLTHTDAVAAAIVDFLAVAGPPSALQTYGADGGDR